MSRTDNLQNIVGTFHRELQNYWPGPSRSKQPAAKAGMLQDQGTPEAQIHKHASQAAKNILTNCFKLHPSLWRTIQTTRADPRDIAIVRSIEYRPIFSNNPTEALDYGLPKILNWLRDIPPDVPHNESYPLPDCNNWTEWWANMTDQWDERIGPNGRYHQPLQQEVIEQIDSQLLRAAHRIVHAVLAHAIQKAPSPTEIIVSARERNESPKLSQIHEVLKTVATLRREAGLLPKRAPSPEQIITEIKANKTSCLIDCGTITHPTDMRNVISLNSPTPIYAEVHDRTWHAGKPPAGIAAETKQQNHRHTQATEEPDDLSQTEKILITGLAPNDPLYDNDILTGIAVANNMTKKDVDAVLNNKLNINQKPPPCPMTDVCRSACAERQKENLIEFPSTWTGKYQDCGYYDYLMERNQAQNQQERTTLANQWLTSPKEANDRPTKGTSHTGSSKNTRRRQVTDDNEFLKKGAAKHRPLKVQTRVQRDLKGPASSSTTPGPRNSPMTKY